MIYELRLEPGRVAIVVTALTFANADAVADEGGHDYDETLATLVDARRQLEAQE